MLPCVRRLRMPPIVLALGSMVPAVADESIPEAVLSFARTLTGTGDPNHGSDPPRRR